MEFGPILRAMTRNKMRFLVIAGEIALTLAVVVNCVNIIQDARAKMGVPSGFDDDNLLFVRTIPFHEDFKEESFFDNSIDEDLRRLGSLPGVVSATHTYFLPWQGGGSSTVRKELNSDREAVRTQRYPVYGDIVETLGVKLAEGRYFDETDFEGEMNHIVISKAFADLVFPEGDAVGKFLANRNNEGEQKIIGVIDRFYNPYPWPIENYVMFEPGRNGDYERGAAFLVRVEPGMLDTLYTTLETQLLEIHQGRNVSVQAVNEVKDEFFAGERVLMGSMGAVIFLLVFVTGLGIVGLTSFAVTERTRQIGTRRALGAQKAHILRYFLLENWLITSIGIVLGVLVAVGLNFLLGNINGVPPMNWNLLVVGAGLLWVTGLLSVLAPALRGSRISPSIATKNV